MRIRFEGIGKGVPERGKLHLTRPPPEITISIAMRRITLTLQFPKSYRGDARGHSP